MSNRIKNIHYGTQRQQLKNLTKKEYQALREMCFLAKNLYNVGTYNVRQHYFNQGEHLNYEANYHVCKENENYKLLNSNIAQQILKEVDSSFRSFFGLIKLAKEGKYDFRGIKSPKYLDKEGFFSIIIGQIRIKEDGILNVPMSPAFKKLYGKVSIKVPQNILEKKIKEIRIIPKHKARFFEIQYCYEIPKSEEVSNQKNALAIDLGLENLCTCVTNLGDSFIIDGKRLKSVNQWANKQNYKIEALKLKKNITAITRKQFKVWNKRNNQVKDYVNKTCFYIIDYCVKNNIGNLIVGYNAKLEKSDNMERKIYRNFIRIPFGEIKGKLEYLCKIKNINFIRQEESYTSKSDFFADDFLPDINVDNIKKYDFKGERITRGQYKSSVGIIINADVNASLNILKKSQVVNLSNLQNNPQILKQPQRVRIS
ncbi:TPA: RNA-guided endonuclease InsQ/TnpB family protein [Clostridioides difficile]